MSGFKNYSCFNLNKTRSNLNFVRNYKPCSKLDFVTNHTFQFELSRNYSCHARAELCLLLLLKIQCSQSWSDFLVYLLAVNSQPSFSSQPTLLQFTANPPTERWSCSLAPACDWHTPLLQPQPLLFPPLTWGEQQR
jgi:hypothetical protein